MSNKKKKTWNNKSRKNGRIKLKEYMCESGASGEVLVCKDVGGCL